MWTAACCTFHYMNGKGKMNDGTRSTAFYAVNEPGKGRIAHREPWTGYSGFCQDNFLPSIYFQMHRRIATII